MYVYLHIIYVWYILMCIYNIYVEICRVYIMCVHKYTYLRDMYFHKSKRICMHHKCMVHVSSRRGYNSVIVSSRLDLC